jgi:hypothetical protein
MVGLSREKAEKEGLMLATLIRDAAHAPLFC